METDNQEQVNMQNIDSQQTKKFSKNTLYSLMQLRLICNHPDLINKDIKPSNYKLSGKLIALKELLQYLGFYCTCQNKDDD